MCSIFNIKKIELNIMTNTINITYNITEMDLTNLSKPELLAKCQEIGILKCKSKNREALIELINNHKPKIQKKKLIIEDEDEGKDTDKDADKDENKIVTPQNDNIVILNADCMVELSKLADNSIDCVITDPPYFIDKLDNKWSSNQVNSDVKNSHIKHLPKGMKFDKSQVKNLYDYYLELSKLLFKKMKPGAYFLSFYHNLSTYN